MTHQELIKIAKPLGMTEANFHKCVDGSKTETRRVITIQPPGENYMLSECVDTTGDRRNIGRLQWIKMNVNKTLVTDQGVYFPVRYKVGDICYLREPVQLLTLVLEGGEDELRFAEGAYMWESYDQLNNFMRNITNEDHAKLMKRKRGWYAPTTARFMLKSFARHFVEITGVRAERLQDITEKSSFAEGITSRKDAKATYSGFDTGYAADWSRIGDRCRYAHNGHTLQARDISLESPRYAYASLWNSINPKENTWDDNPWVWVFSFETVEATS